MNLQDQLGPEWYELLGPLFAEDWMEILGKRLGGVVEARGAGALQPSMEKVFRAYQYVQPSKLKVLILGQDPYPNGQADGFAFSTKQALPPLTLRIVFDELKREGMGERHNPDLSDWAEQGVMLLNTILTCGYRDTLSHEGWGWEKFIAATLERINELDTPFVVMGWGTKAKDLIEEHIEFDHHKRLYLKSIHPVAQSRSEGRMRFVGCDHFALANAHLRQWNVEPIEWNDAILQKLAKAGQS